jgi:gamma-glutamyltranspeptidase
LRSNLGRAHFHLVSRCRISTQPPNSSAVALLEELNIREGFDTKALGHNGTAYLHRLMEAVRLSLADRNRCVADTDAIPVPVEALLSKPYADRQRSRIDPERATAAMSPGELSSKPVWRVEDRIAPDVIEELRRMGHRIEVVPEEGGMVSAGTSLARGSAAAVAGTFLRRQGRLRSNLSAIPLSAFASDDPLPVHHI